MSFLLILKVSSELSLVDLSEYSDNLFLHSICKYSGKAEQRVCLAGLSHRSAVAAAAIFLMRAVHISLRIFA